MARAGTWRSSWAKPAGAKPLAGHREEHPAGADGGGDGDAQRRRDARDHDQDRAPSPAAALDGGDRHSIGLLDHRPQARRVRGIRSSSATVLTTSKPQEESKAKIIALNKPEDPVGEAAR